MNDKILYFKIEYINLIKILFDVLDKLIIEIKITMNRGKWNFIQLKKDKILLNMPNLKIKLKIFSKVMKIKKLRKCARELLNIVSSS